MSTDRIINHKSIQYPLPEKTERNLLVFQLREKGLTFAEIGKELGITRVRAQQIYKRQLKKLAPKEGDNQ